MKHLRTEVGRGRGSDETSKNLCNTEFDSVDAHAEMCGYPPLYRISLQLQLPCIFAFLG